MQDNTINELDHKFFTLDLDTQSQYLRDILAIALADVDQATRLEEIRHLEQVVA
jgi:hypothetical protein